MTSAIRLSILPVVLALFFAAARTLSLRDLVLETGRRVDARYRTEATRRIALAITVEATAR